MRVLCPGRIEIWREDNQLCRKPSALTKAPPLLQFSIFSTGNGLGCMQSAVDSFAFAVWIKVARGQKEGSVEEKEKLV